MEILAHRTGMARAPSNSLKGLRHCFWWGADEIECDITFVRNEPFVWTDDTNNVLNRRISLLADLTPAEIRALKRNDCGEHIMQISDVFAFLERYPNTRIYFDVQYSTPRFVPSYPFDLGDALCHFKKVDDGIVAAAVYGIIRPAVERGLANRIGFVTFCGGADILREAKKIHNDISTDLIVIFPWTHIEKHLGYLDAITVGWKKINHWKLFPRSLKRVINAARSFGLKLRGGVANTSEEIVWARDLGLDSIWTDDIPNANSALKNPTH